ncbi:MAG: endonuclease V [Planctomycetes bacterium]|nr:endonuclease V [Planctomycetota bacterium]
MIPLHAIPDLPQNLRELLVQIPAGRVTTYTALAEALGHRIATRWVGHFLLHHDHAADCPCHRVVRVGGHLGRYCTGDVDQKARLLRSEGIAVHDETVDLGEFFFDRFQSDRPLEQLRRIQAELPEAVILKPLRPEPKQIGGVDVSYTFRGPITEGVAGYALVEPDGGKLIWSTTVRRRVIFPYISTFLAFRELPLLLDLLDEVRSAGRLADLVLVDGSGILHPHTAGIATHLGVVTSLPTVGVTKKLLCGDVRISGLGAGQSRPVIMDGQPRGVAIRATEGSRRPIFVSPGHRTTVAQAEAVVRRLLCGRRLPEPLYWADRLSRSAAREISGK